MLARDSALLSPTATAEDVLRHALTESRLRTVVNVGKPLLNAAVAGGRLVVVADDGSVLAIGKRSRADDVDRAPCAGGLDLG